MSQPVNRQSPLPVFFPVSLWKLTLMSVCTVGLYQIHWFYWNWRLIKQRERRRLSPPWRSMTGLLFAFPLFRRILREEDNRPRRVLLEVLLFLLWTYLSLAAYAPTPWTLVSLASVIPLLPIQAAANAMNIKASPGHDSNSRFSSWNIVAIVVGGTLLTLNLLMLAFYLAKA